MDGTGTFNEWRALLLMYNSRKNLRYVPDPSVFYSQKIVMASPVRSSHPLHHYWLLLFICAVTLSIGLALAQTYRRPLVEDTMEIVYDEIPKPLPPPEAPAVTRQHTEPPPIPVPVQEIPPPLPVQTVSDEETMENEIVETTIEEVIPAVDTVIPSAVPQGPVLSEQEIASIQEQWYASVRSIVEKRKKYPKQALLAEIEGVVTVQMVIGKSGTIQSCKILSGKNGILERGTLAALADLKSVPPVPDVCKIDAITIELPLLYELQ
jgi:TonB family protein